MGSERVLVHNVGIDFPVRFHLREAANVERIPLVQAVGLQPCVIL